MRTSRYIAFLLLVASGGAALATILNTPKPAPFAECENQYPDGLIGTWRVDHNWTDREDPESQPDPAASTLTVAANHGDMSTVTITADAYISNIPNIGKIERTYQLVGGSTNRYTLEFIDRTGAVGVTTVELVPCGLMMEQNGPCLDTFCRNFIEEVLRTAYKKAGQVYDDDEVHGLVEQTMQAQAQQPQTRRRTYFRRVADENPQTQGVAPQ